MKYGMIKRMFFAGILSAVLLSNGCGASGGSVSGANAGETVSGGKDAVSEAMPEETQKISSNTPDDSSAAPRVSMIDGNGNTLRTRILLPPGYERTAEENGSLTSFLRDYEMKEDGSPVLLYDGSEKGNQNAQAAVFRLPLEDEDLQQCADSVMRVYGEYYYRKKDYKKIRYSLGGGFKAEFDKWSRGYGIGIDGDTLYWTSAPAHDDSYESFQKFMRMVFAYSGTLNLEEDSEPVGLQDISVGDMFIRGGSPGHVVLVVDLCENAEGKKAFLLAQGYMPAQEFHVLKNSLHEEDPWYYEEEVTYPLQTPEYTFEEGALRRPKLSPLA